MGNPRQRRQKKLVLQKRLDVITGKTQVQSVPLGLSTAEIRKQENEDAEQGVEFDIIVGDEPETGVEVELIVGEEPVAELKVEKVAKKGKKTKTEV